MRTTLMVTALMMGLASGQRAVAQDSRALDSVTTAFRGAMASGDVTRMKGHFADSVVFAGDVRFVGGTRELERMVVSRDQLAEAYTRMFGSVDRAQWAVLIGRAIPKVTRAARDGEQLESVKAGDYVYALSQPGRSGADDTLLFVLRPVGGRFRIVAHYADY